MMAVKDIRRYAPLLGCRLDSAPMKKALAAWEAEPNIDDSDNFPVGEIPVYDQGIDIVLAFNERWGTPKRGGKSPVWAAYMRFFGPEYGKKRKIVTYPGPILADVTLPSTRTEVRKKLGPPTRFSDSGQVCDEYDQDDCIVRFCYPAGKEFVVFVELAAWSVIDRKDE